MADDSIFSKEILDALTVSEENSNKGPVTVLGKTFANDDERRAYFREELRKKLPELKKIEGYPIGEDDDIINLSDPPYYTACPNPWLNEIIGEWELEKRTLLKEGKRQDNLVVKEPYSADIKDIKNDSVYRATVYHTKVPQTIIMKYLLHYTQPGDIVFDGFAGTGMTGLACQSCESNIEAYHSRLSSNDGDKYGRRHCICIDLSTYASIISYNYNTPVDIPKLKAEIERIQAEMETEYGWVYKTKHTNGQLGTVNSVIWTDLVYCSNCGHHFKLWDESVDKLNKQLKDVITCPKCGSEIKMTESSKVFETIFDASIDDTIRRKVVVPNRVIYTYNGKRYEKSLDQFDYDILNRIEETHIPYFFPTDRMPEGGETRRNDKDGITHVHHLYTKRNLLVLSAFYDKINKSPFRNKLLFLFSSMITRSTKMNRVHFTKYLNGKNDWDAGHLKGTMYIPSFPVESSVLSQIKNKLERFLKAAPYFPAIYDNVSMVASSENTSINDNSIDYIFVDPPFGANINYSELNFMSEAWLKVITNNTSEAIENPNQDKDSSFYYTMMKKCFAEFYRILKPGKWMTVEFSNTSASVWNSIQQAISKAGFVIANVAALDKGQGGMRSVSTKTAVKEDLAISCYKPAKEYLADFTNADSIKYLWDFVDEHLNRLPVCIQDQGKSFFITERDPRILYDRVVTYYVQHGYDVPIDSQDFQAELNNRYIQRDGMFFNNGQVVEYEIKKRETTEFIPLGLIVSNEIDGIEWIKRRLETPKTYQDLQPEWLQAIKGLKQESILPELKTLLNENFIENEDGTWRIPNIQDDVDKVALRNKVLLKTFNAYVELASKSKSRIKEVRTEALRAGFKDCYIRKDFQTIVMVGDKIPQNLLTEDEILLQFYDIAVNHV